MMCGGEIRADVTSAYCICLRFPNGEVIGTKVDQWPSAEGCK